VKARRALSIEEAADENAKQLKDLVLNAKSESSSQASSSHQVRKASQSIKTLKDPKYVHGLNREHSEHSNPIVGSANNSETLHVLIVVRTLMLQTYIQSYFGIYTNFIRAGRRRTT